MFFFEKKTLVWTQSFAMFDPQNGSVRQNVHVYVYIYIHIYIYVYIRIRRS